MSKKSIEKMRTQSTAMAADNMSIATDITGEKKKEIF